MRRKHHGNRRMVADVIADADEHERKREGRIGSEGAETKHGAEGLEMSGTP